MALTTQFDHSLHVSFMKGRRDKFKLFKKKKLAISAVHWHCVDIDDNKSLKRQATTLRFYFRLVSIMAGTAQSKFSFAHSSI